MNFQINDFWGNDIYSSVCNLIYQVTNLPSYIETQHNRIETERQLAQMAEDHNGRVIQHNTNGEALISFQSSDDAYRKRVLYSVMKNIRRLSSNSYIHLGLSLNLY